MDKLYGHWPKVGSSEHSLSTGQLEERSPQTSPNHFDTFGTHGSVFVFLQHLIWYIPYPIIIPLFMESIYLNWCGISEPSHDFTSEEICTAANTNHCNEIQYSRTLQATPLPPKRFALSPQKITSKVWEDEFPSKRWDMLLRSVAIAT